MRLSFSRFYDFAHHCKYRDNSRCTHHLNVINKNIKKRYSSKCTCNDCPLFVLPLKGENQPAIARISKTLWDSGKGKVANIEEMISRQKEWERNRV